MRQVRWSRKFWTSLAVLSRMTLSVIIPAHNEETTIGRCLESLLAAAREGEFEVIVICNGCTDRTAEVARSFQRGVTVIEIDPASKYLALREGDRQASGFPRFYIDADVVTSAQAVRDVAGVLVRGEAAVAAPRLRVDLSGRPWYVRSYYQIWTRLPYAEDGIGGTGFYALSEAGRSTFDGFPDIIADDQFVVSRFDESERCSVDSAEVVVAAPWDWRGLIHQKTRNFTGNRQLEERFGTEGTRQQGGRSAWVRLVRRHPSLLPSVPVYILVCAVAEARSRRQVRRRHFGRWERDASTRVARADDAMNGPRNRHGAPPSLTVT